MTDRHKRPKVSFRPAADDQAWLEEHAERTGQAVNAILCRALAEFRQREDAGGNIPAWERNATDTGMHPDELSGGEGNAT